MISGRDSNFSPGTSDYQRIISNNSFAHDEQEDNPGQEKEGSTLSSINCDCCWCLVSSVKVLAALTWAEADRRGKFTGWRCISASQVAGAA